MASQLGKRYKCAKCGTEVLCTKAGAGQMECCGEEMKTQEAKPILPLTKPNLKVRAEQSCWNGTSTKNTIKLRKKQQRKPGA